MPELPEVETVKLQLSRLIIGKTIKDVEIRKAKIFRGDKKSIVGKKIVGLRRFSKLLVIDLDHKLSLAIHLKMTGRLVYEDPAGKKAKSLRWEFDYNTDKHTHIVIHFSDGSKLHFHDLRQFGYIQVVDTEKVGALSYVTTLGPEFFRNLDLKQFREVLGRSGKPIKLVLMDQQKVAGVGNIYANEALWCAKIDPRKKSKELSENQVSALFACLEKIMREAIKWGGASENDFRDAFGQKGSVQNHFQAYTREGHPCTRCHTPIRKFSLGGRGTYYCSVCQKD